MPGLLSVLGVVVWAWACGCFGFILCVFSSGCGVGGISLCSCGLHFSIFIVGLVLWAVG